MRNQTAQIGSRSRIVFLPLLASLAGSLGAVREVRAGASLAFSGGEFGFPPPVQYQSDGSTPIPADSGYTFELGVFVAGFTPTAANTDDWLANWRPIADPSGVPVAGSSTGFTTITSVFGPFDGFLSEAVLTHNTGAFAANTQTYIWGFDNRDTAGAGQWILITNSATWRLPVHDEPANARAWSVGSSEPSETLIGSISGPSMTLGAVTVSSGGGSTSPQISVADNSASEVDGNVSFDVRLSSAAASPVTVNYQVVAVTASAGADFSVAAGTVTIPAGNLQEPLAVSISQDSLDESDETFRVDFSNPQGASLSDSDAVGTIIDDDPPPTISMAASATAYENAGAFQIPVTLSAESGKFVSANVIQSVGNLVVGTDVSSIPASVTFAPGETQKFLTINIIDDAIPEVNKSRLLALGSPTNGVVQPVATPVNLLDDDAIAELADSGTVLRDPDTGAVTIGWDAVSGRIYQVMFSTDLTNWTVLPGAEAITAGSSSGSFVHSTASGARLFYKVVDTESTLPQ